MEIDIVPIKNNLYRGVERALTTEDLYSRHTKKHFNDLLKEYFDYLDVISCETDLITMYKKILPFYHVLIQNNISCELIIFNECPISEFLNVEIELMGIDVLNQHYESLIVDYVEYPIKKFLNRNLLLNDIDYIESIKEILGSNILSEHKWTPYYVYHLEC